jgi:hypothetical protein
MPDRQTADRQTDRQHQQSGYFTEQDAGAIHKIADLDIEKK